VDWRVSARRTSDSFPLKTLQDPAGDPGPHLHARADFEEAQIHDPLWNAAQRQLVTEGRMHNYLRMLWGKKILEWSASPQEALQTMIELNNRFALDGRDPNSWSGIFWTPGRFDRAWGPERPIFGKVRSMSSVNTARKTRVKEYLKRWSPASHVVAEHQFAGMRGEVELLLQPGDLMGVDEVPKNGDGDNQGNQAGLEIIEGADHLLTFSGPDEALEMPQSVLKDVDVALEGGPGSQAVLEPRFVG
jgi:hypothetical protein